jgi:peptide/nickel transport system permease protein
MKRYLLSRILSVVPLWIGISALAFFLSTLVPGDPAQVMAQRLAGGPPTIEQVEAIRREYHLDEPLVARYGRWLVQAAQGNLGRSYRTNEPVLWLLVSHFPATLLISLEAFAIAFSVALPLGIVTALKRSTLFDQLVRLLSLLGASMPSYWLGYMLILFFSVKLGWLPVAAGERVSGSVLPALTLSFGPSAVLTRLTRSCLIEVLNEDYIRTARSKGLSERTVIVRHALKGALVPVVTVAGIIFGHFLGGAIIVEKVFAWPGIGKLIVDAIYDRDYPMIQGFVLFTGTVFTVISITSDLINVWLDPRIHLAGHPGQNR